MLMMISFKPCPSTSLRNFPRSQRFWSKVRFPWGLPQALKKLPEIARVSARGFLYRRVSLTISIDYLVPALTATLMTIT